MSNFVEKLKSDLAEQFKEKPVITALIEVIGEQMDEVHLFFEQLHKMRSVDTSLGKQLDGIGDIVVLTRKEAGVLACIQQPSYVLSDEDYRKYLKYKIWKNNSITTYEDIMRSLDMFYGKPIHYSESLDNPACMEFKTDPIKLSEKEIISTLFNIPLIRAAGVGYNIAIETVPIETEDTIYHFATISGAKVIDIDVNARFTYIANLTMRSTGCIYKKSKYPIVRLADTHIVVGTVYESGGAETIEKKVSHV